MDLKKKKSQLYTELKVNFPHLKFPYKQAPDWALTNFFEEKIKEKELYYFELGKKHYSHKLISIKSFEFYICVFLGVLIGLLIKDFL